MAAKRSILPVVVAMTALLAACGGAASESGSPEQSIAAESVGESVAPSAAADVGELCAVEFETCTLEAGTYSVAPFAPEFTFVVDEGWTNERAWPDGGGVSKEAGAVYWLSGVTSGTVAEQEVEIEATVDGFVSFLQSLEAAGMTVSDPSAVEVDGAAGMQVDVESNDVDAQGLLTMESDFFNLVAQEKARFLVVDADGEVVVFIIDSFLAEDFDDVVATGDPVISSIRWSP